MLIVMKQNISLKVFKQMEILGLKHTITEILKMYQEV